MQRRTPNSSPSILTSTSRRLAAGVGLVGLTLASGCVIHERPADPSPTQRGQAPQEAPANPAPPAKPLVWTGERGQADKVPFPGRVVLPEGTCKKWGIARPQPLIERNGEVLAVVDARQSFPPNCNYLTDSGAGVYTAASIESAPAELNGSTKVPDGTVVKVGGYAIGQTGCNRSGGSNVWLSVTSDTDQTPAYIAAYNMGFSGSALGTLDRLGIQQFKTSGEFIGTAQGGC